MDLTTYLNSCGRFEQFQSISTGGGGGLKMCMFKGRCFFFTLDSFESRSLEANDIFFPKSFFHTPKDKFIK